MASGGAAVKSAGGTVDFKIGFAFRRAVLKLPVTPERELPGIAAGCGRPAPMPPSCQNAPD